MGMDYLLDALVCKLLAADPGSIDSALDCIVSKVCPTTGADFLYVSRLAQKAGDAAQGYSWHEERRCPVSTGVGALGINDFPYYRQSIMRMEPVHVRSVDEMPPEAHEEKRLISSIPAGSISLIPLGKHKNLSALMVLGSIQPGWHLSDENARLLKRVGFVISEFLGKRLHSTGPEEIEARMQAILDASMDAILCFDGQGTIMTANKAICGLFGYTANELGCLNINSLLPGDPVIKEWLKDTAGAASWTRNVKNDIYRTSGKHKDGRPVPLTVSLNQVQDGNGQLSVAVLKDNAESVASIRDELIGMSTRTYFMKCLRRSFQRAQRDKDYCFAVLLADIDRFKLINDGLGHKAGDKLLELVGRRLLDICRPGDNLSWLGGDEFAFILHYMKEPEDAAKVADRVLKALEAPFTLKQQEVFISASIGIAMASGNHEDYQDLLRDADNALFSAKGSGRGRHETFRSNMRSQVMDTLVMEADMHKALKEGLYRVYYQPILSLTSGEIIGFEALIRWQHPTRGLLGPDDFIPLSEETMLVASIGEWVLRSACEQLRQWKHSAMDRMFISVNCSTKHVIQPGFTSMVRNLISEYDVDPRLIELEITESIALNKDAAAVLRELRSMGLRIAMDDFGTGYSSLSELNGYPLDTVKIDKSFVENITSDSSAVEIVMAIMSIAWKLNLRIIAEGVETVEQLEFFRAIRCDAIQGYLFAKPMPSGEISSFMHAYIIPPANRYAC